MTTNWKEKIESYCKKYNIPLFYLAETLYEPKVVPMIRGKAFEFSVMTILQKILPKNVWQIEKPVMNAQIGFHDIDVRVLHKPTQKLIRIECKLAKKGGYRLFPDGHSEIRVKCMRSRTLGESKVKELAPKLGVTEKSLSIHNDQYLPVDFDIVISSIGNAFYTTDKNTGFFEWKPTKTGEEFLRKIKPHGYEKNLKDFAFEAIYVAKTKNLAIGNNHIVCTRAKCKNKKSCGFIPNYPIIYFDKKTNYPNNNWVSIDKSLNVFEDFIKG
ncbi:MAG: restriction endonuclease [Patescibacteria group bacterium]